MLFTPKEEIQNRIDRLRPLIEKASLDGAFFHYKIDYFYLSGTMQDGFLFVPLDSEPVLFVKRELKRARRESPLKEVIPIRTLEETKTHTRGMKRIGLQLDVMPYNMVMKYKELLPEAEFINVSPLTKTIRKKKSPFEIKIMEKAAAIARKVYERVPEILHEGMSEIELGGLMESYAKPLGHEGLLRMRSLNYEPYTWHILSGRTGSIVSQSDSPMGGLGLSPAFPVGASLKKMRKGEPILVDFGISYHGYHMDLTRMYAIGYMPEEFVRAYEVCRDIHNRVLGAALTGMTASDLFYYSKELAHDAGFGAYYLGYDHHKVSFLGHGIGVELSEFPFIAPRHDYPIEEGMTFALEPKMVLPRKGASGIENTVVIERGGYRILSDVNDSIIVV
ncbi:MAG: Xaa-Pro dipeptidase [Syntrophorhabdaceae bacterium PtaU1.Bin034]|nr:MAG: Xaa-Pro dipeptidase [Syntrophorhabdaceae bacterium PtaU1.Bin034]